MTLLKKMGYITHIISLFCIHCLNDIHMLVTQVLLNRCTLTKGVVSGSFKIISVYLNCIFVLKVHFFRSMFLKKYFYFFAVDVLFIFNNVKLPDSAENYIGTFYIISKQVHVLKYQFNTIDRNVERN